MRLNPRRPLAVTSLNRVVQRISEAAHPVWCGALSFEDRCSTSLELLTKAGCVLTAVNVLNYSTDVRPLSEHRTLRESGRKHFEALAGRLKLTTSMLDVDAYSFDSIQHAASIVIEASDFVVWDLSCLTKIHTMALACALAGSPVGKRWALAYTVPDTYNLRDTANTNGGGWSDIIVAPLADTAELFNEGDGRGIVIPGHEGDRLIVGLAEIEPAGGTVVLVESAGRPDLRALTERRNQRTMDQLLKLRASNWKRVTVPLTGLEAMAKTVAEEIARAKKNSAPVILFPYGPKPLVALTAFELVRAYPRSAWFVYPVPASYDVRYSQGASATFWIGRQRAQLG